MFIYSSWLGSFTESEGLFLWATQLSRKLALGLTVGLTCLALSFKADIPESNLQPSSSVLFDEHGEEFLG
jgi:hypothetical protein